MRNLNLGVRRKSEMEIMKLITSHFLCGERSTQDIPDDFNSLRYIEHAMMLLSHETMQFPHLVRKFQEGTKRHQWTCTVYSPKCDGILVSYYSPELTDAISICFLKANNVKFSDYTTLDYSDFAAIPEVTTTIVTN